MENNALGDLRYWVEPAHPMVIKLRDDLVAIYRFVKDKFQNEIDAAFDLGSQQIGFVVTTTVPVILEVGEGGSIKSLTLGSDCLKDTALEKELLIVIERMKKADSRVGATSGIYNIALFWYDAVNLKLRTDWMEPAHPAFRLQSELMGLPRSPQSARAMDFLAQPQHWMEPAHPHMPWLEPVHHGPWCRPWMEPAHPVFQPSDLQKVQERRYEHTEPVHYHSRMHQIILEKTVLVSAIDEVYPELKLGERLNQAQYAMSPTLPLPPPRVAVWPGVREPAHMMPQWASGPTPDPWRRIMAEIAQMLERYDPEPSPWKYHLLFEIASLLHRYSHGMLNPQPLPPGMTAAWPGVREPAHMMAPSQWARDPQPDPWRQMLFPGVREPAHPMATVQQEMPHQILSELATLLRGYGFQI